VSDEIDQLRARVAELERRVAVLFEQTGAADWEAAAADAPPVSDEVRALLAAGDQKAAVKRYQEETGAGMAEAAAALGEAAKQLRGEA
jgi:ribosomal protein L7/L12